MQNRYPQTITEERLYELREEPSRANRSEIASLVAEILGARQKPSESVVSAGNKYDWRWRLEEVYDQACAQVTDRAERRDILLRSLQDFSWAAVEELEKQDEK